MKISAIEINDYKRVKHVAITPAADRDLILLGGKNAAGKSSVLDALMAAFGGKKMQAADPVRHGAAKATIFVELDGGKLTIERDIKPDGSTTIEVRDPDGIVKSPQTLLDRLVGARSVDPLAFLQLDGKEQRAQLMRLIPGAAKIDEINAARERGFTRRTELGRDMKKAEAVLASLPITDPGKAIDVKALHVEARTFAEQQRAGERLVGQVDRVETKLLVDQAARDAVAQRIEKLQREIVDAREQLIKEDADLTARRAELEAANAAVAEATAAWVASADKREKLEADIARADTHNKAVYAAQAEVIRRERAQAEVDKLKKDTDELTAGLKKVEDRKAALLAEAKLPVEGLAIGEDGLELNGVPFAQASGAERLRVAVGLAIAASPELGDIWIHDAALLDEDSLALVGQLAAAANKRVWLERVGTRDPGAIVISDGQVVA